MKRIWFLFFLLFLYLPASISQQVYPDSLVKLMAQARHDSLRLNLIRSWCLRIAAEDLSKLNPAADAYIAELKKSNEQERLGAFYRNLGDIFRSVDSINQAIDYYNLAAGIATESGKSALQSLMFNEIGNIYLYLGDFNQALEYHFKSLSIREETRNTHGIAASLNNIGAIYFKKDSLRTALNYYLRSLAIEKNNKNDFGIASCYGNIGSILEKKLQLPEFTDQMQQLYDSALWYYQESAAIFTRLDRKLDIARSYISLANIYDRQNLPQAMEYYQKALTQFEEAGDKKGLAETYLAIGTYYHANLEYKKSLESLLKSQEYGRAVRSLEIMARSYELISECWAQQGEFKKAYEARREFTRFDKLFNDENAGKKFTRLEMNYTFDKKQREQAFLRQQEKRRQMLVTIGILAVLVFVSVLAYVMYRSYRIKQRDNVLLAKQKLEIENQRDEIAAQRDLVTSQRDQIVKQKEEITDSIHYASRIQSAILPPEDFRNGIMHEHFVLFNPRDIVSGDFYWMANKNGKNVIIGADCTGHGVPGAFMSMLGVSFLHQIVNEFEELNAATILNKLREQVIRSLRQTGKEGENKDGMDISLMVIDEETMELEFAGAYNPCYIIRNGEINELKADRMPIGIYSEKSGEMFKSQKFQLQKNDTVYCASDGYEDQFGGPDGKKLKVKAFKEILLSVQDRSMKEQRDYLESFMADWKKGYEQVDDVLVIGFKI